MRKRKIEYSKITLSGGLIQIMKIKLIELDMLLMMLGVNK